MSGLDELEQRLAEFQAEREALLAARTVESTAESARSFLEAARRRSERVGAHVLGVHAIGSALDDVVRAFVLSDPRFEGWLVEQAQEFAQLTEKTKAAQLKKLDAAIVKAQDELREARKAAAIEQIERDFAPEAA